MKTLKREIFHIAGKDYEKHEQIEFTFKIEKSCIETFFEQTGLKAYIISFKEEGSLHKAFTVRAFTYQVVKALNLLGLQDWAEIWYNFLTINHSKFRKPSRRIFDRINFYSVYNPTAHTTEIKSNSPIKMNQKQAILGKQLWRKLPVNY